MKIKMKINPKSTVKITDPLEMVGFIRTNGTACQFVSMLTVTEPKLKVSCPFKGVTKVSRRNGLLNVNYNTAVRRRISKALGVPLADVEYTNGAVWFAHEIMMLGDEKKNLPLVFHATKNDGKKYLQYFPLRSKQTRYVLPNGEEVSEEQLKPYFYAKSEREEYKPNTCVFKIESIKELRASGVVIQTDETEDAEANLAPA